MQPALPNLQQNALAMAQVLRGRTVEFNGLGLGERERAEFVKHFTGGVALDEALGDVSELGGIDKLMGAAKVKQTLMRSPKLGRPFLPTADNGFPSPFLEFCR